jgi:tetratricopeptide (TPR) repeat protein/predicted Ser/Thr protein kinase
MDPERWERIQDLFHAVADLPAQEQRARLDALCADDPTLVAEVVHLLDEDVRGDSLLNRDLAEVADQVLAGGPSGTMPRQIGPYRLRQVIGEGGMGVVYLAERADLDSRVAIKILRDAWLSPARRERFASEQRTLAKLSHPSIARIYDADTLPDGTPWFAMEYVEGVSLTRYCATQDCSISRTLELFRAVCEAVLHAHQHAVIHRDLKPSNILVTGDGQVRLLDFGIAKQLETLGSGIDRTRTDMRLMTPAYASPEQIRGGELGVHTDIYSLGVILYELLAGRLPFDLADRTPGEVDRIVTEQEPVRPSVAAREVAERAGSVRTVRDTSGPAWADLDVLCLTAMHKDLGRRYRSVDALIRDIDRFLHGEPLEARPATVGYRVGKFVRRNRRAVSAVSAALVVVIGLVTFYTVRLATARNAALAEAERTRRIQEFMNNLFEGGDEEVGPSDSLRVVTLLGRGVQEARALATEPAVQAELFQTLGGIYQNLGDLDRADSLLQASLDLRRSRLGPDHPDVARSLLALGILRAYQSELDDAERLVREGLALSRRRARADPAALARATTALGMVLVNRGTYDQAIVTLTEAARLDSAARLPDRELSGTLTELANSHFYAGHYAISDSLNRRVVAIDRAVYGDHHPHVASDLINLGAIQFEWGHYPEAVSRYREALEIYRAWYGNEHFETAAALTMIGRALIPQKRLAEADTVLKQALAIREHVYGPDHPNVASTLNELAKVAQQEGRLDEAEAGFRRMARIYQTTYHDNHYLIGIALANLAGVYVERKDYVEAVRLFHDALRRYAATLPADHLYVGIGRIRLGRAILLQGHFAEAERETRSGYEIVSKQSDASVSWLTNARRDLVAEYEALKRPDEAAKFRAEIARLEQSGEASSSR